ncbi:MAG: Gfo/Idh/MocA family oxidoreductase, partial [Paludisphaera borealis]|uniref:Gfo/Idh/MocA family protein n=1 Tax=Paludisphaera borealis TaxID=1387353 RepID=UPI00283C32EF
MDANGLGRGLAVGFLVVGAGPSGARRAAAVAATPGAKLVALHDADGAAAQAIAVRHSASASVGYASALDDDAVDAVVITTPHADHFEQAWAALEAGKHVLCEAPLALRPRQGRMLAARADELGLVLATGFPTRFVPPVRDA